MSDEVSDPSEHEFRRALARARRGASVNVEEAAVLVGARGAALQALCEVASAQRDVAMLEAGRPGQITYSRKVFIPVTRLCRDRCRYCTFATVPGRVSAPFLSPDEVVTIARQGAEAGCHEALLTLGDAPELRWPVARQWLDEQGFDDTLAYVRALAVRVLEETGLLPHINPGVMSWTQLQSLRAVAPSLGMMLETTSVELFARPDGAHFGSPDKDPAVRLRVLEDAGRCAVPFTTGLLVGIGESLRDRAETLCAIRESSRRHGHVQECIVQNFLAKPDTAMRHTPHAHHEEFLAAIATARVVLDPSVSVQVPPNLSALERIPDLIAAGADDLGGISPVTPDHVNPERPWPQITALSAVVEGEGMCLRPRLTAHARYVRETRQGVFPWIDSRLVPFVEALADADGWAAAGVVAQGRPWQADLPPQDAPGAQDGRVYGPWAATSEQAQQISTPVERWPTDVKEALRRAEREPSSLNDKHYESLLTAEGPVLDAVVDLADQVRADRVGEQITFVVNRNLNFSNICFVGCRFCAFAQRPTDAGAFRRTLPEIAERVREAAEAGATEICMQGGIDPAYAAADYLDLVHTVRQTAPQLHVHAFSPMEIVMAATRAGLSVRAWIQQLRDAGVGTFPGTAAEILDDEVRWVLTKGKLPTSAWVEVVETAHEEGVRTTSTMMFGHVDHPRHWVTHLRVLRGIQDRTRGFTEFVPLPFIHTNAPVYVAGVARPGPSWRDIAAVTAVSRLLLDGAIANIQASWVKVGEEGVRRLLQGGANDVGGTLMEETISSMAGSRHGSSRTPEEIRTMVAPLGRPVLERTTLYGRVPQPQLAS